MKKKITIEVNNEREVIVQRKWLKSLLELAKKVEEISKEKDLPIEVYNLMGYASSAEFILAL